MGSKTTNTKSTLKLGILAALLLFCTAVTYYSHFVIGAEVVYTHIFYIPIILAGLWFGTKALFASLFLIIVLLASHLASGIEYPLTDDTLRAVMFITVGCVLGMVVEEKDKLHREALAEKNGRIEQMENHAKYVDRVAHELRNPLQVLLGVLDTVELGRLTKEENGLIKMLHNAADEMTEKIKELTRKEEYG